jgi:hypothetical protein
MHLFHFSTCFKQPRAHRQDNQLYQYIIWYMSLCVGDLLECRSDRKFLPDLHTRRSPTQSDTYQLLYWYNWFSWWWERGCSKHVEKWNKCIRIVRQVSYLQDLYQNAWSSKHKKIACVYEIPARAVTVLSIFVISLGLSWEAVNNGTVVSEKLRGLVTSFPICSCRCKTDVHHVLILSGHIARKNHWSFWSRVMWSCKTARENFLPISN